MPDDLGADLDETELDGLGGARGWNLSPLVWVPALVIAIIGSLLMALPWLFIFKWLGLDGGQDFKPADAAAISVADAQHMPPAIPKGSQSAARSRSLPSIASAVATDPNTRGLGALRGGELMAEGEHLGSELGVGAPANQTQLGGGSCQET